ncbi:hypothetical protein IC582_013364 [Cucumis melo]
MNWLEHLKAHKDFSCQKKFLCSKFLFSLPEQKPSTTQEQLTLGTWPVRCRIFKEYKAHRLKRVHLNKQIQLLE